MNRRLIFVSTFSAVLMMSMVAFGQPAGRWPGRAWRTHGRRDDDGSGMLLRQEAVQKELSITDEQKRSSRKPCPKAVAPVGVAARTSVT